MRELRFGISVTPYADGYPALVEQVLAAERGGLDLVGIQDHPYQRRFLDTFALIADLLARTSTLRFFPDVASLPMRPPAMIAKAAASLDVMSGGRFELGLGAGAFWDAVAGMGGRPRRRGARRRARGGDPADPGGARRRPAAGDRPRLGALLPDPRLPGGPAAGASGRDLGRRHGPQGPRHHRPAADGWVPGGGISRIAASPG